MNFVAGSVLASLGKTLTVSAGTVNLNDGSAPTVATFNQAGGIFQGSDSLTVTGTMNWSAGTLAGSGSIATRDLVITQTANVAMSGTRALVATGNTTWNTTGLFNVNLSGTNSFTNQGSFTVNTAGAGNWTGGTFNNQGTLTKISTDSNNFTTIFNNTGSLVVSAGTMQIGTVSQIVNSGTVTTLTAGSWEIDNAATLVVTGGPTMNITVNNASVTLSGPSSIFARIDTLATNNGSFHVLAGRNFTTAGAFTNNGVLEIGGGTFSASILTNNAPGTLLGFGNANVRPASAGSVIASGGTLVLSDGINGTSSSAVQINPTGLLDLSAGVSGTTTGSLTNNGTAANALILGGNNILVSTAYANANFGSGNAFNKHANLSATTGKILANGDNKQTLAGDVTAGTSASPTMAFGNVHVGDLLTRTYQIDNFGATSGPSVLFAIQPGSNGGTITDARLSGSGVASSNIGPVAYGGASASLNVTFGPNADGPLTGQFLHIANNFDNISEQTLSITGAAYNLAAPIVSGTPINLGNFHVGDPAASAHFTLANGAPADGFSEALDAATASPTGGIAISGAVNLLAPGASDNTSFAAALASTATAGHVTGTALLNLTSDGAGSSGLGQTALTPVTLSASANIFRLAAAGIPANITLTSIHVGDPLPSATFFLTNSATNDGFSEKLDASILSTSGALSIAGTVNLLAPGATNSTGIAATLGSSSAAGHFTGSATLSLTSDGAGTSNLGVTSLPAIPLSASINIFRLASVASIGPIDLGNVHVGDPLPSLPFAITNGAINDGFSEKLDASTTGSSGSINITGALNLLAPGAANNSSIAATLASTSAAGHFTGSATLLPVSDGAGTSGLGLTSLAGIPLAASANVFRLAVPTIPSSINLGNFHVGDPLPSAAFSLTNSAASDGFSEKLTASTSTPAGLIQISGAVSLLNAGGTNTSAIAAGLSSTAATGHFTGNATLSLLSDGAGTSGLGQTPLASIPLSASASVFRFAAPNSISALNLGNFHVGDPLPSAAFSVTNTAANDTFSEKLDASAATPSGAIAIAGSFSLLAPGASNSSNITATLSSSANAGHLTGSALLSPISNGTGTSNLGQTPLLPVTLSASANVFRLAIPSLAITSLTLPNVHVGDPLPSAAFTLSNNDPNDGFSEKLNAAINASTGPVTLSGSALQIAPGASSNPLVATLGSTAAAGHFTGTASIASSSDGAGTSNLGQTTLASIPVSASANVFRLAAPGTIPAINLGNVHVGDPASAHFTVSNTAPADGFSEKLLASFTTHTGAVANTSGTASINPNTTDSTALSVSLDTSIAGLARTRNSISPLRVRRHRFFQPRNHATRWRRPNHLRYRQRLQFRPSRSTAILRQRHLHGHQPYLRHTQFRHPQPRRFPHLAPLHRERGHRNRRYARRLMDARRAALHPR